MIPYIVIASTVTTFYSNFFSTDSVIVAGWPPHGKNREFGCSFSGQGKLREFAKKKYLKYDFTQEI